MIAQVIINSNAKDLNLDIPACPETVTPNYLKNVRNVSLIQYFPKKAAFREFFCPHDSK